MSLSIVCIVIVGGMGWLWLSRGFYSALLNLVCVLIAGAVAFGVWETVAYMLLDKSSSGDLLSGSAWGIALALPFAVTLAVLRAITDKVLRANLKVPNAVNYIGGAVCGAVAGVVTAGIVVMSLGMLRMDTQFMGFQAMDYGPGSSLKRENSLLLPVDKIVAQLYGHMSRNTLATDTPLAVWQPHLDDLPSIQRISYGEGSSRNTMKPEDCRIGGHYLVGGPDAKLSSLLTDSFAPGSQQVADLTGEPFPPDSRLEGIVVTFNSGAKEKNGQVIIGPGQVRLVAMNEDGSESIPLHPIAVVSRTDNPAKKNYARFRLDARELYIPSVGGDANTTMAFEFVVPKEYKPTALYIKSTRFDVPTAKPETYASPTARDLAIKDGTLVRDRVDEWGATEKAAASGQPTAAPNTPEYWGISLSDALPDGAIIQDGTQGPNMEIAERRLVNGTGRYETKVVKNARDVDRSLQVNRFRVPDRTSLVQVNVSKGRRLSFLGQSIDSAERILPPQLVSTDGQVFEAIGYYYEDESKVLVRYMIGEPIRGLSQLDTDGVAPTISRADQKLILIFAPSKGVEIKSFNLGSKVIREFERPIKTTNE